MKKIIVSLIAIILILNIKTSIYAKETKGYKDLKSNHWAYQAICKMSDKGILTRLPDGNFGINQPMTKEAYATMIVKAFDIKSKKINKEIDKDLIKETFEDVKSSKWSFEYVEAVSKYMKSYKKDGKLYFNPNSNITREEMVSSLVMLLGLSEKEVDLSVLDEYKDANDISQDLKGLVALAIENKIISGDGKNINPLKALTRAEASLIVYNVLNSDYKINSDIDDNLGKKYLFYNDGYVKFMYPIDYHLRKTTDEEKKYEKENMKSYHLEKDDMCISLYYTLDPNSNYYYERRGIGTTTLSNIMKYLNKGIYSDFEKNNYNNNYVLMNYISEYGNKNIIYGRGIDTIIPQVVVSGKPIYNNGKLEVKNESKRFNEDKYINEVSDIIRNSFSVVSKIKAYQSKGLDKATMETSPENGAINVSKDLTFEVKCNAELGWGSKYILKDKSGKVIDDIEMYFATLKNVLKIKFGRSLEKGMTYMLEPIILNDIDGNYINADTITFTIEE